MQQGWFGLKSILSIFMIFPYFIFFFININKYANYMQIRQFTYLDCIPWDERYASKF